MEDLVVIISIISSMFSIILAIFAIWFSLRVEERLKRNFLRLKSIMDQNHDRTKILLSNIDHESESIKRTVFESQNDLQSTLEKFMEECGISKK